jgi:hypothetical protein
MNYYYAGGGHCVVHTFLPDTQTLARYSFKAVASNQKAQLKLGYTPRVTFEKGMELTVSYLKWAYGDMVTSAQAMRPKRTSAAQAGVVSAV